MSQESADMLQRDTLPMRVLNVLMDWIMDGKLKMGDKLNTEDLARQLAGGEIPFPEGKKTEDALPQKKLLRWEKEYRMRQK